MVIASLSARYIKGGHVCTKTCKGQKRSYERGFCPLLDRMIAAKSFISEDLDSVDSVGVLDSPFKLPKEK